MIAATILALGAPLSPAPLRAQAEDPFVHPSRMTFPPLTISFPEPDRRVLPNGMVVYLRVTDEIPLVTLEARVRTGEYLEPDEKLGLASMTGSVMRTGGTTSMTGDEIDEALEFMGASVETGIDTTVGWATLSSLTKTLDDAFPIFVDVVRRPRFDPDKIELQRAKEIEGIRRRNDQPGEIVAREYRRLVLAGHPYARVSTMETVTAITRDDMVTFHAENFAPNNIIMAVSGAFDPDAMMARLERAFGDWSPEEAQNPDPPEVELTWDPALYLIEKDVPQTNIRMGHRGLRKSDPDYFGLIVLDNIVGSNGFISRMMREIRSNRGLAYSVGTYVTASRVRGTISAYCQTKSGTTVKTLSLMKEILSNLELDPVTEEELNLAKESILNSFVFRFTSAAQVVRQQVELELTGLPADWLQQYRDAVSKVTVDDVMRVARAHLHPLKMTVVIVGAPGRFDPGLDGLGWPVKTRPLEDFTR